MELLLVRLVAARTPRLVGLHGDVRPANVSTVQRVLGIPCVFLTPELDDARVRTEST
jgi:hypothetical protein